MKLKLASIAKLQKEAGLNKLEYIFELGFINDDGVKFDFLIHEDGYKQLKQMFAEYESESFGNLVKSVSNVSNANS